MPWYRSKVEVAIDHRTSLKSALQLVYIEVEALVIITILTLMVDFILALIFIYR